VKRPPHDVVPGPGEISSLWPEDVRVPCGRLLGTTATGRWRSWVLARQLADVW